MARGSVVTQALVLEGDADFDPQTATFGSGFFVGNQLDERRLHALGIGSSQKGATELRRLLFSLVLVAEGESVGDVLRGDADGLPKVDVFHRRAFGLGPGQFGLVFGVLDVGRNLAAEISV